MARFYFHFANGKTILDEVGTELPALDAVREEALATTRELMFAGPPEFWAGQPCRMWVTDRPGAAGTTILALQLSAEQAREQRS